MDEILQLAYRKSLESIVGQLDAIFTLQAQNELQAAKIAKLEKELEGETAENILDV